MATTTVDQMLLKSTLISLLGIDKTTYDQHPIVRSLTENGVTAFFQGLLLLREDDIMGLGTTDAHGTTTLLSITHRRNLVAVAAYYHDEARPFKQRIDPRQLQKAHFDNYRVAEMRPKNTIVPFKIGLPEASNGELSLWNKKNRLTGADFKIFKDEAFWLKAKERIETTLDSGELRHLIKDPDPNRPVDKEVDEAQRKWLYKVFQDIIQHPRGKQIVTAHLTDKDTRAIWKEMNVYYELSMLADL